VVRTLEETVALEARTKVLNPKWYEAMMKHGYEGVEEIKKRVDYTYGWSATAQATPTWFYDEVHETFIRNEELRERMQKENPDSYSGMVDRLFEANRRNFWNATDEQLKAAQDTFRELTSVLGLKLEEKKGSSEVEAQVIALIAERTEARKQKQWKRSDELRDQLKEMGVTIEDSKDGTTWRWG